MATFVATETDGRSIVVVGVDFSEPSGRALIAAGNVLRGAPEPELHIVHVFPTLQAMGLGTLAVGADALMLEPVRQARTSLESVAAEMAHAGGRVITHLRFGDAAKQIVQLASDIDASLVVVGTHGRTGLERVLLGSTAERVVRTARCAVLTVPVHRESAMVEIDPPCAECLETQRETRGAKLWCQRHTEHHSRAHLHYEYPPSFAVGAQTFRQP